MIPAAHLKRILLSAAATALLCGAAYAQNTGGDNAGKLYTIEECYALAEQNYPLIKKYAIIKQSAEFTLANANKAYLPQLGLGAQATYQSEVTSLAAEGLPVHIAAIPKDQYKASVTLSQIIWDGGSIASAKKITRAGENVDKSSLETDMYTLRERINNLFFGILLAREQIRQTEIYANDLEISYKNIGSFIAAGIANASDLDIVQVEQLKNLQRKEELEATLRSYRQMLSYFTGAEIAHVAAPEVESDIQADTENRRPELEVFNSQLTLLETRKSGINAAVMPKFSLFAEGGYGNPALNMLKPGWRLYGLGGIKMSWNFGSFYTRKGEMNLIKNNISSIENQRDVFLFNSGIQAVNNRGEIYKAQQLLAQDDKIIALRENIIRAARKKTENGTMTVNELLKELNAGQQAKQDKIYHRIQLMMAVYNLKYTLNQ